MFVRARQRHATRPSPRSARAITEPLEARQLLSTTTVSDLVGPSGPAGGSSGRNSVSDGTYAYYYGKALGVEQALGIFRTDGTAAGTTQLGTVPTGRAPAEFTLVNGRLYFTAAEPESYAAELYTVDPGATTIRKVGNFARDGQYHSVRDLVELDGRLYFIGHPNGDVAELHSTDGTAGGTRFIRSLGTGDNAGAPDVARVGDGLYFSVHGGGQMWSVHRTDGTTTSLVKSAVGGAPGGFVRLGDRTVFNVRLYTNDLWVTDGTEAGTQPLGVPGGFNLTSAGDFAVFHDENTEGDGTRNVYVTDGTAAGTKVVDGLHMPDFYASFFAVAGGAAYVPSGWSGASGLFRVTRDGAATRLWTGEVYEPYAVGDRVYFAGSYQTPGDGPFLQHAVAVTDGTRDGTWILEDRDDTVGGNIPTTIRRVRSGVIYGLNDVLYSMPADAPGLPKYSGRVFHDLDRDGVYDPGEPAEVLAELSPRHPIGQDGTFSALAPRPFTTHIGAQPTREYVRLTTPAAREINLARGQITTGVDFGFTHVTIFRGTVRVDADANDVANDWEPPAPGRTVFADYDRDGVLDDGEPRAVTGADGAYVLDDLPPGQFVIRVAPPAGEFVSAPVDPPRYTLTASSDGVTTVPTLGVTTRPPRNYVSGRMFQDHNRNATQDAGEPFITGGRIWIDYDEDGRIDVNDPWAQSSATSDSVLQITSPGTFRLRYEPPSGWVATAPTPLVTLATGQRVMGLRLPVAVPAPSGATIAGVAFNDTDQDGVRDDGEMPRANTRVYLDADNDFALDPAEQSVSTDSLGRFAFVNLAPGRYAVRQELAVNSLQTTPAPGAAIEVDLAAGEQRTDLLFGSRTSPQLKSISGPAFIDEDVDGVRDTGETLSNTQAMLYIDANNNGTWDEGERAVGLSGPNYSIGGLAPGRYRLRMVPFSDPLRLSNAGPDGSYVVDVPMVGNPAPLEVGLYRPNATVSGAWLEASRVPFGARVTFGEISQAQLQRISTALTVTDAAGNRVTPTRVLVYPAQQGVAVASVVAEFNQALPAGTYTLRIPGTALKGSAGLATPADYTFTFAYPPPAANVVGRHVFYNRSAADGHTPAVGPAEDAAIDPTKSALLPGQAATLANVTNYVRGVNGIMIDVAGLPRGISLVAPSDFTIRTSADGINWSTAGIVTPAITIRRGAGVNGSDRITLAWPDMPARNKWLNVVLRATPNTGLAAPDSFFYGNLAGETFDAATGNPKVNAADAARVRAGQNRRGHAPATLDFNRDRAVNAADLATVRENAGRSLPLLTAAVTATPLGVDLLPSSDSGISSTDNLTNRDNSRPGKTLQFAVTGTVAGATVTVYAGGVAIGAAIATGPLTTVTTDASTALDGRTHPITARQALVDGTESGASPALPVTVVPQPPATPPAPDLIPSSDTGSDGDDHLTSDTTPSLETTAGPYYDVYRDGVRVRTNAAAGTVYNHTGTALPDGVYAYTVAAIDAAGNASAQSAPLVVTIDSAAPAASAAASNVAHAGGDAYTFSVTYSDPSGVDAASIDGADVVVTGPNGFSETASVASVTTGEGGAVTVVYRITPPGGYWDAPDGGTYTVALRPSQVSDKAGNAVAPANLATFSVASTGLGAPNLLPESDCGRLDWDDVTNLANASPESALRFRVVNTVAGATVRVFADGVLIGSAVAAGTATLVVTDGATRIPDGTRSVTATQTPSGGAEGPPSPATVLTIDTVAPTVSAALDRASDTGPADGVTRERTPVFNVTTSEAGTIHLRDAVGFGGSVAQQVDTPGTYAVPFAPPVEFVPSPPLDNPGVAVAVHTPDVNGDGRADFVTSNRSPNGVSVLLSNGDGTFRPTQSFSLPREANLAFGDTNWDGKIDLLATQVFNEEGTLIQMLGNGDGTFGPPTTIPVGENAWNLDVGDIDGDGNLDVAVSTGVSYCLSVLFGRGDGTFEAPRLYNPFASGAHYVRIADANGDGRRDVLLVSPYYSRVYVFLNDGTRTFGLPRILDVDWPNESDRVLSVDAADFNRDGTPDLLAAVYTPFGPQRYFAVFLGKGGNEFAAPSRVSVEDISRPVIADIDRDGDLDLTYVHSAATGRVVVVPGNGDGTFAAPRVQVLAQRPTAAAAADFNGDGHTDLAAGLNEPESDLMVYFGRGGVLLYGRHSVIAWAEDLAGNRSPDAAPINLTIDAEAPQAAAAQLPGTGTDPRKRYRPRPNAGLLA